MSDTMNEFLRCRSDCFLGIKAYQNLRASHEAFDRLSDMVTSNDFLLLSSLFQVGVVRYAKPFLRTNAPSGSVSYPLRRLKRQLHFSSDIHNHILAVRNTLVAHDDFEEIEPRMLILNVCVNESDLDIPVAITLANKCVSHPADLCGVEMLKGHVTATLEGVSTRLDEDLRRIRTITIEQPEQAKEATNYTKHYGREHIPESGKRFKLPDFSEDDWLEPDEPDFSEIHSGFRYEKVSFSKSFNGPETIKLPNGETVVFTPPAPTDDDDSAL